MPDLNLVDEGEMEESSASTPTKVRGGGGGGGGMTGILIMVLVLVIVGGGGFFMYKKGIGPFKRKQAPLISQVQEESFPQEPQQQPPAEQQAVKEQKAVVDTTDVALLETPAADESKAPAKAGMSKQPDTLGASMAGTTMHKLGEMKGDYTVQVIAFREKGRAEKTVSNLETAGYPAFAETIPMKGGDWYTVRIGRYPSRQDAKKAVETFGAQLRSSYVIDKVRNR